MSEFGALVDELAGVLGDRVRVDAPLGVLTTYRVGGRAAVLVDVGSEEDLQAVRRCLAGVAARFPVPVLVLGKGSNLLVADAGFHGVVVRPGGALGEVSLPAPASGEVTAVVRAGGAAGLPVVARRSLDAGLTGLEWMVGIPGSVGGALKMNAGGHGSDVAACLVRYRAIDVAPGVDDGVGDGVGDGVVEAGPERLRLDYRTSTLADGEVVVWAELAAARGDPDEGRRVLGEIVRWRREHQPGGSNAGSVFTNPPGDSAGRLIDAAGLKGRRVGSAEVSAKHANFIQADDEGSADDVLALLCAVRDEVAERTGVVLRPEVKLVGFPPEALP